VSVAGESNVAWGWQPRSSVPPHDSWLTPVEQRAQERFAVPKRRDDWRLGRWTAKHVVAGWLQRHGRPARPDDVAIVARAHDDGFPVVSVPDGPAPSISITHCDGVAVCIAGRPDAAVGCDLERIGPRPASFAADWFTPAELQFVDAATDERRSEVVTLIWSAKESALKALGQGLRIDTRAVEVQLDEHGDHARGAGWQGVSVVTSTGRSFSGWWWRTELHVLVFVAGGGLLGGPPPRPMLEGPESGAGKMPSSDTSGRPGGSAADAIHRSVS
jgi:4'-phosphopantetheinyl transferase